MLKNIYTIYDVKSKHFMDPIIATFDELEQFLYLIVNQATEEPLVTHPGDFLMYEIGYWSPDNGLKIESNSDLLEPLFDLALYKKEVSHV